MAKILVFGAGAVGSVMGAGLALDGKDVHLVGRPAHVEAIRRQGLAITGAKPSTVHLSASPRIPSSLTPDIVVIAVKTYDLPAALEVVAPALGSDAALVLAENGLGNWERAVARFPHRRIYAGSVITAASVEGPGVVRWSGAFGLTLGGGRSAADSIALRACASTLHGPTVHVTTTDNLAGTLWLKAIVNAALTVPAAVTGKPHGALVADPAENARMRRICAEASGVARAEGVVLPEPDPWAVVERIAHGSQNHRGSMAASLERGQPTEIDAITGYIVEAAKRHGIALPENDAMLAEIRRRERLARSSPSRRWGRP
ncbi:MAG: ketopantoate reductase family protein [Thermoplasmatota archaeon]